MSQSSGGAWTADDGRERPSIPTALLVLGMPRGRQHWARTILAIEEAEAQIRQMVSAPVIPDVSVGGIPLLDANGEPYIVDSLSRPEDGKFADPTYAYADAFIWGATQSVDALRPRNSSGECRHCFSVLSRNLEGETTLNGRSVRVST